MSMQLAAQNIARVYFRPPPGKPVVVACDQEKLELARAVAAVLEADGHPVIVPHLEGDAAAVRAALNRLLEDGSISLAVFASHSMWQELGLGRRFTMRQRQPSLEGRPHPLFFDAVIPLENLLRLYAAAPESILKFVAGLRSYVEDDATYRLTTPAGTDLTFTAREWQPWGWELMTCPVEASIRGKIVADGAVFFERLAVPSELEIIDGALVGMQCEKPDDPIFRQYRQWMMEAMESDPLNAQLCEVGLGANPGAQLSPVVMESEAVQGTLHVCFGDNARFEGMGGQNPTDWHGGTVVLKAPRLARVD